MIVDLAGKRIGRLQVMELAARSERGRVQWKCICDCGNSHVARHDQLMRGRTKSCGCLQSEMTAARNSTHGHSARGKVSREYTAWVGMNDRCSNPKDKSYANYGGRGIIVCERWLTFENFLDDMGPRPSMAHSVDRIDTNGNYEPDNCRWATVKQQARNRRSNKMIPFHGLSLCAAEWADRFGISSDIIVGRLRLGWSVEKTLMTHPKFKKKEMSNGA